MTKPHTAPKRRTGGLKPPIRAAHHLAQRQRERDRWSPTRPLQPHERQQRDEAPKRPRCSTTDRILIGASIAFLLAAIAIKTLPPL